MRRDVTPVGALVIVAMVVCAAPARLDEKPADCRTVEAPNADGSPVVLIPAGVIPMVGPLEFADLLRRGRSARRAGHGPPETVTCVQYVPPDEGEPPNSREGLPRWIGHVEAAFWSRPPFERGGCRAKHGLSTIYFSKNSGSDGFAGSGMQLLEPVTCKYLGSGLTKGR